MAPFVPEHRPGAPGEPSGAPVGKLPYDFTQFAMNMPGYDHEITRKNGDLHAPEIPAPTK
jgi:hypothetical protein